MWLLPLKEERESSRQTREHGGCEKSRQVLCTRKPRRSLSERRQLFAYLGRASVYLLSYFEQNAVNTLLCSTSDSKPGLAPGMSYE